MLTSRENLVLFGRGLLIGGTGAEPACHHLLGLFRYGDCEGAEDVAHPFDGRLLDRLFEFQD